MQKTKFNKIEFFITLDFDHFRNNILSYSDFLKDSIFVDTSDGDKTNESDDIDDDDDDNVDNHNFEDIEDVDIDVNIDDYNDIHFGDSDDE